MHTAEDHKKRTKVTAENRDAATGCGALGRQPRDGWRVVIESLRGSS